MEDIWLTRMECRSGFKTDAKTPAGNLALYFPTRLQPLDLAEWQHFRVIQLHILEVVKGQFKCLQALIQMYTKVWSLRMKDRQRQRVGSMPDRLLNLHCQPSLRRSLLFKQRHRQTVRKLIPVLPFHSLSVVHQDIYRTAEMLPTAHSAVPAYHKDSDSRHHSSTY